MKVLEPGHVYALQWLDGYPEVAAVGSRPHSSMSEDVLIFVKREGDGYPGNVGHHPGTTIQEVLRALIDRIKYLDGQIQCTENYYAVTFLRDALFKLEYRAADRHGRLDAFKRLLLGVQDIERLPTCPKCLHIGCPGTCHE